MNPKTEVVIREVATATGEGRMPFGLVIEKLTQAGVESYAVDYRARRTTYFLPDGEALDIDLDMHGAAFAQEFDPAALQSAIRGSQQGVVKYPQFKQLSSEAGCIGYTVWIAGRHVTYYGRRGETHVERFPS